MVLNGHCKGEKTKPILSCVFPGLEYSPWLELPWSWRSSLGISGIDFLGSARSATILDSEGMILDSFGEYTSACSNTTY